MTGRRWKLRVEWKPADCWVGLFWKRSRYGYHPAGTGVFIHKTDVWLCVLPMLPVHLSTWKRVA